jgi:hypothetical protein
MEEGLPERSQSGCGNDEARIAKDLDFPLQELKGIAEENAGLAVATTKCLGKCKQGPSLSVTTSESVPRVCVSKEKPPKKEKKQKILSLAF